MVASQQLATGLLGESYVVLSQSSQPHEGDLCSTMEMAAEDHCGRSSAVLQATSMHERLRTVGRLFQLTESCDPLECSMPLCKDCALAVLHELQHKHDEAHEEHVMLQAAFVELEAGDELDEAPLEESDFGLELGAHRCKREHLHMQLIAARRDQEALQLQVQRLRQLRSAQQYQEEVCHALLNAHALTKVGVSDEGQRCAQLLDYCHAKLKQLETLDAWRDLFEIDSSGDLGTINTMRLGRLPGVSIEWAEINAALGQVILLICALAMSCELDFSDHKLVPMGSFSKLYKCHEPQVAYELYGSGSAPLGRLFGTGRLDRGVAMLLCCVNELLAMATANPHVGTAAVAGAAGVHDAKDSRPPHAIEGDLVGGLSVRLFFNQEEQWTRAFRNLLENLSWMLAWRTVGNQNKKIILYGVAVD